MLQIEIDPYEPKPEIIFDRRRGTADRRRNNILATRDEEARDEDRRTA